MKTFLVPFAIICSVLVGIDGEGIAQRMEDALDFCLDEYQITEDELESSSMSSEMDCFGTCVALRAGLIENKKFNMEKFAEYLRATESPDDATEMTNSYNYCLEGMLDIEDECESMMELEKCVDEKLWDDSKKK